MPGLGKIPWITEGNPWQGLPNTARIPTGGWRGMGAVPSHSYPEPTTLPGGYWRGIGHIASTDCASAQRAKTHFGFGATTGVTPTSLRMQAAQARDAGKLNEAAILEAQAKSLEDSQKGTWTKLMETLTGAGTQAYTAQQTASAQTVALRSGQPLPGGQVPAVPYTPSAPAAGGGNNTLLYVGAAVGIGLIALMALR